MNNLGTLYSVLKEYNKSESALLKSLQIEDKIGRIDQIESLKTMANLADLYSRQKRYTDASAVYGRMVSFLDRSKDIDDPVLEEGLNAYAKMLTSKQDFAEAERLRARAMQMHVHAAIRKGA